MRSNHAICSFTSSDSWIILSPIEQSIKSKIESVGTPLSEWDINIYRGILTGYNEAFLIDSNKREELLAACRSEDERKRTTELIRPILRGKDIKRYGYKWAGLWLINTHNGVRGKYNPIDINDYPTIKHHLDKYWDKISTRDDKGVTPYNLRNCAYMDDFFKPKIVYGQFQDGAEYSFAEEGVFLSSNEYMLITHNYSSKTLLAFLNCKTSEWLLGNITGNLGGTAKIGQKSNFLKLSIAQLSVEQQKEFDKLVDEILLKKKQHLDTEALEKKIDEKIYKVYNFTEQEIKEIERC